MATLVHSQREVWKSQSENTPVLLAMMIIIRLNPVVREKVICHCHLETQSRDICAAAVLLLFAGFAGHSLPSSVLNSCAISFSPRYNIETVKIIPVLQLKKS